MRLLIPAAIAAVTAAAIPAAPALASSCGCGHRVVHHRAVHRVSYVRPVVRRVVYRPRIVEVVRPVVYRPVRRVFVEPIYRPRPVFYGARFHHRPHYGFYGREGFRGERDGYAGGGYRHEGYRGGGYRHDGFRGGDFHRGGYGWR